MNVTYMAITEYMEEHEVRDFDQRLLAKAAGPQRPDAGMEALWGVMGRPAPPPGTRPAQAAPPPPRRPAPTGRKVGETP